MKPFWSGGFLYNPDEKEVLLHKRDGNTAFNPNMWAFFGGLQENEETPLDCFVRELEEELSINIDRSHVVPLIDYLNEEFDTYRYVFYLESQLKPSEMELTEGESIEWVSIDRLNEYDLTEKTERDLKTFLTRL